MIRFSFILTFLALAALPRMIYADDFLFSITPANPGDAPVTGEIEGLASSGISTPTAIYIFSQPTGYAFPANPSANLLASGSGWTIFNGDSMFAVTSGAISGANFGIYETIGDTSLSYAFNVDYTTYTGANGIYQVAGNTVTDGLNTDGLPGVTYTAVPEPRQATLILVLAGVGLLLGRKLRMRFFRM